MGHKCAFSRVKSGKVVYDDKNAKMVLEITLPSPVLAVRLKRDTLVAVCRYIRSIIRIFNTTTGEPKAF